MRQLELAAKFRNELREKIGPNDEVAADESSFVSDITEEYIDIDMSPI